MKRACRGASPCRVRPSAKPWCGLAAEGLVTTLPNRNTVVATIDFSTVPVYFDALTLMYRVTTRLAALRRGDADLAAIRELQAAFARSVRDADALAMISVNRDFHLAIARAGRNRYYTEFFARLLDEGRRLLRLYYSSYDDHLPQEFVDEHDGLIAAIVERDAGAGRPACRGARRPGRPPDPEFPGERDRPRDRPRAGGRAAGGEAMTAGPAAAGSRAWP